MTCLYSGIAELFAAIMVLVVVVNAIGLMIGVLRFGEALRNIAVVLGAPLAFGTLAEALLHLGEALTVLKEITAAAVCVVVALGVFRRRHAPRRDRSKAAH